MKVMLNGLSISIALVFALIVGFLLGYSWNNETVEIVDSKMTEMTKKVTETQQLFLTSQGPYSKLYESVVFYEVLESADPTEAIDVLKMAYRSRLKRNIDEYAASCKDLTHPNIISRCHESLEKAKSIISKGSVN